MTKEIILERIEEVKSRNLRGSHITAFFKKNYPDVWEELLKQTSFLDSEYEKINYRVPLQARIYCVEHDISVLPICANPECDHTLPVRWDYATNKFKTYCCAKCCHYDWYRSDRFKNKSKETCEAKYGVKYFVQSDKFKETSSETCMKNFGVKHISLSKEWRDEVKETCRRKYHADSPFESKEIREKIRKSCMEHLGVENPFLSIEIQERTRASIMQNNGGLGFASPDILMKAEQTSFERYGVRHFAESEEYYKKRQRKFKSEKYPELRFDSRWEVKVYEFCKDNNISIEYSPKISYEYSYDGTTYTYHPDFLINGKVYEVKGDNFFRTNKSTGKEEMFCPYGRKKLGEEKWNWLCGKFEAKHQCMLKNNVPILRNRDISNLCITMFVS